MSDLIVHQFEYDADNNYGVLIHDPISGETAAIDAGISETYIAALNEMGWRLSQIWITHHHWDHTDGLAALKAATGAQVFGPRESAKIINDIDSHVGEGDIIEFGQRKIEIIETPGHTLDMLNFHLPQDDIVFTGDTLFTLGCGRLFEGTPALMWSSMQKLMTLPDEMVVYCSHEYTQANADFALSIDPNNSDLSKQAEEVYAKRAIGKPTVPTTIGMEKKTNPFMRPHDLQIRQLLGMLDASDSDVFTEIRARKDRF